MGGWDLVRILLQSRVSFPLKTQQEGYTVFMKCSYEGRVTNNLLPYRAILCLSVSSAFPYFLWTWFRNLLYGREINSRNLLQNGVAFFKLQRNIPGPKVQVPRNWAAPCSRICPISLRIKIWTELQTPSIGRAFAGQFVDYRILWVVTVRTYVSQVQVN